MRTQSWMCGITKTETIRNENVRGSVNCISVKEDHRENAEVVPYVYM